MPSNRRWSSGQCSFAPLCSEKTNYPATVLAPIQKDYAKHKIDDIEIVERDGVITYEAELDGSPVYMVVFDSQGKVLSVKKDWIPFNLSIKSKNA